MLEINIKELNDEELHYEYKKATGGFPSSFWETYSAFANSDGGYIFLGVEEIFKRVYKPSNLTLGQVKDLRNNLFIQANNKEKVNVNLISDDEVEEVNFGDSFGLRIYVPRCPADLKPVYINGNIYKGCFRRNSDGDFHCSIDEINSMIRDSSLKPLDLALLKEHTIDSLDKESIAMYRNMFATYHPDHPFLKNDNETFLEFIGAARIDENGIYHPTKAGLLMFGYSYRIVYEYPDYFLDYQEVSKSSERWSNRIYSDSGLWNGNIFTFFFKVMDSIRDGLKNEFSFDGITRNDDSSLHKAIREALCNTLCNADYNLNTGVVVRKGEDFVEFSNPGCLMMDVDQMIKGGVSDPRNKTLLKMFNLINIGERSGSGIPLIYKTSKERNLSLPNLVEQYRPDRTILTIYLRKVDIGLNKLEQDIISYLTNHGASRAKDISYALNKNITTIKLSLYKLVEQGQISSSGTIKDKRYFVK